MSDQGVAEALAVFEQLPPAGKLAFVDGLTYLDQAGAGNALTTSKVVVYEQAVVVVFVDAFLAHEQAHHPEHVCGHGSLFGSFVVVGTIHGDTLMLHHVKMCIEGTADVELALLVQECREAYPTGLPNTEARLVDLTKYAEGGA